MSFETKTENMALRFTMIKQSLIEHLLFNCFYEFSVKIFIVLAGLLSMTKKDQHYVIAFTELINNAFSLTEVRIMI